MKRAYIRPVHDWPPVPDLPLDVQEAVRTLIAYGVPKEKLLGLIFRKGRGRPKSQKPLAKGKERRVGRPKKWARDDYEILLEHRRAGEKRLHKEELNGKVTDVAALKAHHARIAKIVGTQLSERELDQVSRYNAKRLPDARKSLRKSSGK